MSVTLTPTTLAFSHPGSPIQSISISDSTSGLSYTATSSNTSVATVVVNVNLVFVTPVGQGTSTITVSDGTHTATCAVTVGPPAGPIVISVTNLMLSTGTGSQTFTVSRTNDNGLFSLTTTTPGIISISGSGYAPGPITYTATPLAAGTTTLRVTASDGVSTTIPVVVTGTLTAAVSSPHIASAITISVTEIGYSGAFTPSFVGSPSATITPSTANGPSATFTISSPALGVTYHIKFTDQYGQNVTIPVTSRQTSLGTIPYTFYDETGINPVAPGSQYTIYFTGDPQVSANVVASGFIGVGGLVNLTLDQTSQYTVVWVGQQAPKGTSTFTSGVTGIGSQSVTVPGYCSPNYSTLGYAAQQTANWTRGWAGDQYKQPGAPGTTGIAYALALSFATILGQGGVVNGTTIPGLDTFLQGTSVATRLLSCTGSQIDSFFLDYLGQTFKRQMGETDAAFIARGIIAINGQFTTRAAITQAANAAWQTLGNTGTIIADDYMSNPALLTGLGLAEPYFVVTLPTISLVTDAFFLDRRYTGINSYLLSLGTVQTIAASSLPSLLTNTVNSKKALGAIAVYAQYIT